MRKKVWITIAVVAIFIGLFSVNVLVNARSDNPTVKVTNLKEMEISNKIMISGTLKLAEEQTIYYNPEKGDVDEILVKEGDDVAQGTPLFTYKNSQLLLDQKQNKLQQESADLELNSLKKQLNNVINLLKEDKENEELKSERNQLELQVKQANIEIEKLKLEKETIAGKIADLHVKSTINGKVVEINEDAAAVSNQMESKPFIRIGSLNQMIVEGLISEYDSLRIQEGQTVTLKSEVVPDQIWTGKVNYISYLPNETNTGSEVNGGNGSVQYPIEIAVDNGNIGLKPGFQLIVEIETEKYKANTLPVTTVQQENNQNFVYIVKDGIVERREVTVGITSGERIEIKDGITLSDQVIVNPDDTVTEGMEVNVK